MPEHARSSLGDDLPLTEFRKLKHKYKGELSEAILTTIAIELRDIVPPGRYIGRNGSKPVCVSLIQCESDANSIDGICVVFENIDKSRGKQHVPVADFLSAYRFFAPDCA